VKRKPHEPNSFLPDRVATDNGKIDLAPDILMTYAEKLDDDYNLEIENSDHYKLITRRAVTTHNSWTHNIPRMVARGRDTNYAYMHPDDMAELNLRELDVIDITSETGQIRIRVKKLDTLGRKSIAVPHGWGHQHARGLQVANKTEGVNVNILAADGPDKIDKVSGMAHLTGINVKIKKAEGALVHSWSGI
jgi:formate dehydrogenase